jgi:outer membrane protein assembly factor BamB/DNA-directed RNA polymerase subunit RPC12/RpoP
MAKLVNAKCPECGAKLKVDPNLAETKCEYCGAVSRVEDKKKAKGAPPPPSTPGVPVRPVIRVSSGFRWAWIFWIIFPIIMVFGVGGFSMFQAFGSFGEMFTGGGGPGSGGSAGQSFGEKMQWIANKQPMLIDITRDGAADLIGWVRFMHMGSSADHIAAFDSVNGNRIWTTPQLTGTSGTHQAKAAVAGDKLLLGDPTGVLKAFSIYNGQQVWNAMLGERVERFCGAGQGHVRVEKKDKLAVTVALATGQVTPAGKAGDQLCSGLWTDVPGETAAVRTGGGTFDEWIRQPDLDGINVGQVVADLTSSTWVAVGSRKPGTKVPTAAAFPAPKSIKKGNWMKKKKVTPLWVAAIPGVNPLTVDQGDPEVATIAAGRLIVPYAMEGSGKGYRLACLDVATGRNLWDQAIPLSGTSKVMSVVASDRQIFVGIWTYLHVFDLATGQFRMTIGKW